MKNELVTTLVAAALERIDNRELAKSPAMSEKEKALQAFFETKPFDCQAGNAAKLVGLLTGFTPAVDVNPPELFDVFNQQAHPDGDHTFLTLSHKVGSGNIYGLNKNGTVDNYWDPNCHVMSDPAWARKFIKEHIAAWTDIKLIETIVNRLGVVHLGPLYAALEAKRS